jgi:V/A-type H+-transporting ATPase subunit D
MAKVSATRNELQARKRQLELAEEGMELLEQKRAALVKELLKVADRVVHEAEELQEAVETARRALARAEAEAGNEAVRSAAMSTRGDLPIEIKHTRVMGVTIPEIEQASAHRSFLDRGYFVTGTPTSIDEAASAFEDEVEAILEFAESELHLRFLSEEIQTLSRRVNALEHSLIPRLEQERDYIEMALQERARDERFRLKLAKRRLQEKGSPARGN